MLSNELKRYILEEEFPRLVSFAKEIQTCKRKAVGCSVFNVVMSPNHGQMWTKCVLTSNGPSGEGNTCSGEVGNCGCSHAEPRACLLAMEEDVLREVNNNSLMICTYSPCTNCANIIVDSGIIDAVVYDILTEHDKRGVYILKRAMPVFSREDLCTN